MAERRAIVEETQRRAASVAVVVQRHGTNADMLFSWRRLYQRDVLSAKASADPAMLLPVKVSTPTVLPIKVRGRVDRATLTRIIARLARRLVLPASAQVWLAAGETDLRKGFDGLAGLVHTQLTGDPFSGQLYAFCGRRDYRVNSLW